MNLIELEPARVNALNNWFLKPEAGDLLTCLEKRAKMAMVESIELRTKAKADNDNPNYAAAAEEKLSEAAEFETTVKVLKSFFPDGPFINRIEL
jgi:hypothetical protein